MLLFWTRLILKNFQVYWVVVSHSFVQVFSIQAILGGSAFLAQSKSIQFSLLLSFQGTKASPKRVQQGCSQAQKYQSVGCMKENWALTLELDTIWCWRTLSSGHFCLWRNGQAQSRPVSNFCRLQEPRNSLASDLYGGNPCCGRKRSQTLLETLNLSLLRSKMAGSAELSLASKSRGFARSIQKQHLTFSPSKTSP